ncbi:MAG: COX15/CtaA family protein [Planctomycetota bacterium]
MALVASTFPLIWVGGLVTTYDAGMAVPDWPSTYGYNLFLYPWQTWVSGPFDLFIEHGHRLLGAVVGLIAIALATSVWLTDDRSWMRIVATLALMAVVGQGVLGGMRVILDDRQLAMIHGCVGPAFFALSVAILAFTSRDWRLSERVVDRAGPIVQRLAVTTAVLAYLQLVLGAAIRHLPVNATPGYFRGVFVFHGVMAGVLAVHSVLLVRAAWGRRKLGSRAVAILALISAQILLGIGTWIVKYGWPTWLGEWDFSAGVVVQTNSLWQGLVTTAHVANGSLILAVAVSLATWSLRILPFRAVESDRTVVGRGVMAKRRMA